METVNQDETVKTFTQEEVDAIVGERLKRDRAKYADYDALKAKAEQFDQAIEQKNSLQTELNAIKTANAIRDIRIKVSTETGVPADLLTSDTEDACREQAEAIKAFATPKSYPSVRDGGELQTPAGKKSTRDQFAEWSQNIF